MVSPTEQVHGHMRAFDRNVPAAGARLITELEISGISPKQAIGR